jgi:hypothetical protein
MTEKPGEGGGTFKVAIDTQAKLVYDQLSPAIKQEVKSRVVRAAIDPAATRAILVEGQQMISGLYADGSELCYLVLRFTYDPQNHVIVLATISQPIKVGGPH